MIEVLKRDKCKLMDKIAIESINIPSSILMENAAIQVTNQIESKGTSFLIICGKGNNGGDGLAIARHLIIKEKKVKIYIINKDDNFTDDFKLNLDILKNLTSDIFIIKKDEDINKEFIWNLQKYDVVVDGMFGVGLNKNLEGIFKKSIEAINKNANFIISIDIPSGLDADSGEIRGTTIKANITYSFEVIKRGFLNYKSLEYVGEVKVLPIGIPKQVKEEISDNIYILGSDEYKDILPKRCIYGHKGIYGRALIIAGSVGLSGAAFITTECTVRAGAGLTTLVCPKEIQNTLSSKLIEAMTMNLEDSRVRITIKNADSIAFGPGIGVNEESEKILKMIVEESSCPIIIDADGIKVLAKHKELIENLRGRCIITPHPGEMAEFLDKTIEYVESNRINITIEIAKKYGIIVLLKGYNTIISDGEKTYINLTGNSKMASGGMGDALTGIINALIAQGVSVKNSGILAAYIHGKIADKLSKDLFVVNARDIIENISNELNDMDKS